MQELPSGTVTFLFSDIEGSTRLMQRLGDTWADVIREHNRIMREAFTAMGGGEVDRQGDAFFAVFPRARHAIAAAAQAQRDLAAHEWADGVELRVRMGVHTGEPGVGDEGYLGLDVVRAARICSAANGGQIVVSETTAALVRGDRLAGLELRDLGEHRLKDLDQPERLFELVLPGTRSDFPALRTSGPAAAPSPPLAAWEARPNELVDQALEAVRAIDLGALQAIGPRVERQVAEALQKSSPADQRRAVLDLQKASGKLQRLPGGMNSALAIAGISLLVLVLLAVGLVVLILRVF
jgi:class 3 adenylate cyclase